MWWRVEEQRVEGVERRIESGGYRVESVERVKHFLRTTKGAKHRRATAIQ